ncbi:beta-1,6-N-acetylglucosaminyltransferase [Leptolyngbya sp. FACHB-17]|uniref:beta-1,6-N-acetylglucosaminyltransferase n=1 Tax=unclassified Leptolyngbya TaxID=2650499 RepID=UPI0016806F65|nr:beta-1,6-N-acetylglucosaminyltransferase [Leptolyngbya sp. FACHB-17]MBD2078387.1 hypothetical protein [Leptolyngbya sp. FACHB-17]
MPPVVGFILLTHTHPNQIRRLVDRLNRLFDHPPIVCHHDFSQCPLPITDFTENISFVQPHLQTRWAEFSLVEAVIKAMEQMQQRRDRPQWTILLSGADYPIKPAAQVIADLQASQADFYMVGDRIQPPHFPTDWHREMYARYYTRWLPMPKPVAKLLDLNWQKLRLKPMSLMKPFVPFSSDFHCYAGQAWFCANQRSIDYILDHYKNYPQIVNHFRWVMFSDESYFQTIIGNAPHLKPDFLNDWRYKDWSARLPHPKILDQSDLPKLRASTAHFARKFLPDAPVLDDLDRIIFQLE